MGANVPEELVQNSERLFSLAHQVLSSSHLCCVGVGSPVLTNLPSLMVAAIVDRAQAAVPGEARFDDGRRQRLGSPV